MKSASVRASTHHRQEPVEAEHFRHQLAHAAKKGVYSKAKRFSPLIDIATRVCETGDENVETAIAHVDVVKQPVVFVDFTSLVVRIKRRLNVAQVEFRISANRILCINAASNRQRRRDELAESKIESFRLTFRNKKSHFSKFTASGRGCKIAASNLKSTSLTE